MRAGHGLRSVVWPTTWSRELELGIKHFPSLASQLPALLALLALSGPAAQQLHIMQRLTPHACGDTSASGVHLVSSSASYKILSPLLVVDGPYALPWRGRCVFLVVGGRQQNEATPVMSLL